MTDFHRIYATQARDYDRLVAREDYQHTILAALRRIHPLTDQDVVDLGAGTGRLTLLVAPFVRSIRAFDASQAMLDVAAEKLAAAGHRHWTVAVADNRRLPLPDQCADLSLAGWSFGHATGWYPDDWRDHIRAAVAEMTRILRPGGIAIIFETLGTGRETPLPPTPALAAYYALLEHELGFSATWIRTDYRFASVAEAEELTNFFFGPELSQRVRADQLSVLPECTGIWWRQAASS